MKVVTNNSMEGLVSKCQLVIGDTTFDFAELTLWGKMAETFSVDSEGDTEGTSILFLHNLSAKDYKDAGVLYLPSSLSISAHPLEPKRVVAGLKTYFSNRIMENRGIWGFVHRGT